MDTNEEPSTSARSKQFKKRKIEGKKYSTYPVSFEEFQKFVKVDDYVVKEMKLAGPEIYKSKYECRHRYYRDVYKDFYKSEEERRKMFRHGLAIKPMPKFLKEKLMRMPGVSEQPTQEKSTRKRNSPSECSKEADLIENKNINSKIEDKENQSGSNRKSVPKTANRAKSRIKCKPIDIDSPKITNYFGALQLKKKDIPAKECNERKRKSDISDSMQLVKRVRDSKTRESRRKTRLESKDLASDDSDIQSKIVLDVTEKSQDNHSKSPKLNVIDTKLPRRNKTQDPTRCSSISAAKDKQFQEKSPTQLNDSDADMTLLCLSGLNTNKPTSTIKKDYSSTDVHAWLDNGLRALKENKYVEANISEYSTEDFNLTCGLEAIKSYRNEMNAYIKYLLNLEVQKRNGPSFKLPGHKISTRSYLVIEFLKMSFDDYELLVNAEGNITTTLKKQYETIVNRLIWPAEVQIKISALKEFLKRKKYNRPIEINDIPPGLFNFEDFIQHTNIKECIRASRGKAADTENHLLDQCREALATCCKRGNWYKLDGIQFRIEAIVENGKAVSVNSAEVLEESVSMLPLSVNSTDLGTTQNATTRSITIAKNSEAKFDESKERNNLNTLERNCGYIFRATQEHSNIAINVDDRITEQNNNSMEKNEPMHILPKDKQTEPTEKVVPSVEQRDEVNVAVTNCRIQLVLDTLLSDAPNKESSDSMTIEASKSLENTEIIPPSPNLFQSTGESDSNVVQPQEIVVSTPEAVYLPFDRSATLQVQDCLTSDPFADTKISDSESALKTGSPNTTNLPILNENSIKLERHSVPNISEEICDDSCQIIDVPTSEPIVIDEEETTRELLEMLVSVPANSNKTPLPALNATAANSSLEIFPQAQRLPSNFDLTLSNPNVPCDDVITSQSLEPECAGVSNTDNFDEFIPEGLSEGIDSDFVLSIFENEKVTLHEARTIDNKARGRKSADRVMPPYVSHEVIVDNSNQTIGRGFASVEEHSCWLASQTLTSVQENANKSLCAESQPDNIHFSAFGSEYLNISGSVPSNENNLTEGITKSCSLKESNETQEGKNTEESLVSLKNCEDTTNSECKLTEKISYSYTINVRSEEISDSSSGVILVEGSEDEQNDDSEVEQVEDVDNEVAISSDSIQLVHSTKVNDVSSHNNTLCSGTDKNDAVSVPSSSNNSYNHQLAVNALSGVICNNTTKNKELITSARTDGKREHIASVSSKVTFNAASDLNPGENRLSMSDLLMESDSSIANNSKNVEVSTQMSSSNAQQGISCEKIPNEPEFVATERVLPLEEQISVGTELCAFSRQINICSDSEKHASNASKHNDEEMAEVPQMCNEANCAEELPMLTPDATCVNRFIPKEVVVDTQENQQNTNEGTHFVEKPVEDASKNDQQSYSQITTELVHIAATHEAMEEAPPQQFSSPEISVLLAYGSTINDALGTDELKSDDDSHNDGEDNIKLVFKISRKNLNTLQNYITPEIQQQLNNIKSLISASYIKLNVNHECRCVTKTLSENSEVLNREPRSMVSPKIQHCQLYKGQTKHWLSGFPLATDAGSKATSGNVKARVASICKPQLDKKLEVPVVHLDKRKNNVKSQNTNFHDLQTANCAISCKKLVGGKTVAKHKTKNSEQGFVQQKTHIFRSLPLGTAKKPAADDISNQPLAKVLDGENNIEVVASSTASQILGTDCTYFESSQLLRNIGKEYHPSEEPQVTCNEEHHHPPPEPKVNLYNQIIMSEGLMARNVWKVNLQWKPKDRMTIEMRCIVNNRWISACDESAKLMFNFSSSIWSDVKRVLREIDHFEYRRGRKHRVTTPLHKVLRSLFDSETRVVNVKLIEDSHSPFASCEKARPLYRKPFQCFSKGISEHVLNRMRSLKENIQNNN